MCSISKCRRVNQLTNSACRHTNKVRAFPAPRWKSIKLLKIVKYVNVSIIFANNYLIKLKDNTAIGDFARVSFTKHRDIVVVDKALDISFSIK